MMGKIESCGGRMVFWGRCALMEERLWIKSGDAQVEYSS